MKRHPPAVSTEEGEKKMRNADCGTRNGGDGKQKQHHGALAVVNQLFRNTGRHCGRENWIHFTEVVTAERAGFYKPHPRAYRLALEELNVEPARALFVAGSPADLPGATNVGMPVFWHNRLGLSSLDSSVHPKFISDSLWPLIELVVGGNAKRGLRIAE